MKTARHQGYTATIKYNKLIINGKTYTIKQLQNEIQSEEEKEKKS